jgi:N-acetylmuramic acid 6-phosphate (MurNAc-6-P) etherase
MNRVLRSPLGLLLVCGLFVSSACGKDSPPSSANLLEFLAVSPSAESVDYVKEKTQFQLHTLTTEQRHPCTWTLSDKVGTDLPAGLEMLFCVDEDVATRLAALSKDPGPVRTLSAAIEKALLERRKIYFYGTGATGRLAKQMESAFWRPYWRRVDPALKSKLEVELGSALEEKLIGEMTGADRALISSLEGFEDLQLIGRLQLMERGISKGDVVIEVTEGGETSAGIGTILGAHDQWKAAEGYDVAEASKHLFFVYNNPDEVLLPFERSRSVIQEPGITKINLTTGPQAITGSTRMQATTSETFVLAHAVEDALGRVFKGLAARGRITADELTQLGFAEDVTLEQRLSRFATVLAEVKKAVPEIAKLTQLEADTYTAGHFSTYFANAGLITTFTDVTERSPTFRLFPLDTVNEPARKALSQVWTTAKDRQTAWQTFLGRPFRGLKSELYREPFSTQIQDEFLRKAALSSLDRAGNEQQDLYDFSFSDANIQRVGPKAGDLGVMIALDKEAALLSDASSDYDRFAALFLDRGARLGLILVGSGPTPTWRGSASGAPFIHLQIGNTADPFGVDQQIALKILLNAHSTAIMGRMGKIVGNTMTNVSPTNLKLIGRATYLIQLHVNDVLAGEAWKKLHGERAPITYAEANAVLFEVLPFVAEKKAQGDEAAAEVAVSIVRILESLRQNRRITLDGALEQLRGGGLNAYLAFAREH